MKVHKLFLWITPGPLISEMGKHRICRAYVATFSLMHAEVLQLYNCVVLTSHQCYTEPEVKIV